MGKSTKKLNPNIERINARRRAIQLVEREIRDIDKRLDTLFDQLVETRRDHNAWLVEPGITNKQRESRMNLLQNNMLEFQHEIADLFAHKHKLRDELVRRGDDLASLIGQIAVVYTAPTMIVSEPYEADNMGC